MSLTRADIEAARTPAEITAITERLRTHSTPELDQFRKLITAAPSSTLVAYLASPMLMQEQAFPALTDDDNTDDDIVVVLSAATQIVVDEFDARFPSRAELVKRDLEALRKPKV